MAMQLSCRGGVNRIERISNWFLTNFSNIFSPLNRIESNEFWMNPFTVNWTVPYSWSQIERFELIFIEFLNIFLPFESIESQTFESNRTNFEQILIWLHPYCHVYFHTETKQILFCKKMFVEPQSTNDNIKERHFWGDFLIVDNEVTSCSYRFLKEFTVRVSQSITWLLSCLYLGLENSFSEWNCYGNCIKTLESW